MFEMQRRIVELLNISNDTFATIIITLFVFITGGLFQLLISNYIAYTRRKRYRVLFQKELRNFVQKSIRQSTKFLETSGMYHIDKKNTYVLSRITINTFPNLKSIGYDVFFDAYFNGIENKFILNKRLKIKAFIKIWDAISSASFWIDKSVEQFESFMLEYRKLNDNRNETVLRLFNYIELKYIEFKSGSHSSVNLEYLKMLFDIYESVRNDDEINLPSNMHNKVVKRISELNRIFEISQLTSDTRKIIHAAEHEYFELDNLLKGQSNRFYLHSCNFRLFSKQVSTGLKILNSSC